MHSILSDSLLLGEDDDIALAKELPLLAVLVEGVIAFHFRIFVFGACSTGIRSNSRSICSIGKFLGSGCR